MKVYGPEYKPRAPKPQAPPAKYQWPANKITPDDMAILFHLRSRTGTPINKLLQEAIRKFGEVMGAHAASESVVPTTDPTTITE